MQFKAKQIADLIGGSIIGDPDILISGPSKIEEGGAGHPGTGAVREVRLRLNTGNS